MSELDAYEVALRAALPPFFSPLEVVERVPTTMARAAELGEAGAPEGAIVVAEEQTAGRGRLGRAWVAPPGAGLLVSVLMRPALAPADLWLVASLAGVALVDAVEELASKAPLHPRVGLKWPNDLLLDGRKAAGLLAEAGVKGGRLDWVALGMGANVNQLLDDFPPEVAEGATSVALATGAKVDRAELLGAWGERFEDGYRQLAAGVTGPVLAAYRDRLETLGRQVRADRLAGGPVVGTAVDLNAAGKLVVLTGSGARVEIATADVRHLLSAAHPHGNGYRVGD
ncbi:MAG TPA: biotin--[acetyl-CoA-carboxylase] ligase [Actinomycetes bacterium]|jgi:BirA family biotin operon repressor/biotin-[acetyl-CoA-carboxylase] ligase|nr:biotin--[acetyl-CoA-carboxylase] ligase [Actinomycetes bacterium]